MKKILSFALLLVFCFSFFGCAEEKSDVETKVLEYLQNKYNESFEIVKYMPAGILSDSPSKAYVIGGNIPKGEKVLVNGFKEKDGIEYRDNYISVINMSKIEEKISTVFSDYYSDFSVDINLFKSVDYMGQDKNISVENLLSSQENSVRVMIYIKSNENYDKQMVKIKKFLNTLKDNKIYVDTMYFAFFDDNFDLSTIKEEYRYEYLIDCISRNDEFKTKITNEYIAYWINKDFDYNFMIK